MGNRFRIAERLDDFGWSLFRVGRRASQYQLAQGGRILGPVLGAMTAGTLIYAFWVELNGAKSRAFPKDILMLAGGLLIAGIFYRKHQMSTATIMALVTVNNTASFIAAAYGVSSPAPALFTISLVLCGLMVGGMFLRAWYLITVSSFVFTSVAGAGFTKTDWPGIVAWIAVFAVVASITNLFTREIDRLMAEAATAKDRERAQIVAERTRISRDIHDTLAQGFTGILMQLNAAENVLPAADVRAMEHLRKARGLAQSSLKEARSSVWALREGDTSLDLEASLRRIAHDLTGNTHLSVSMSFAKVSHALPLPTTYELTRIGQEALTNAIRHSGASEISILVGQSADGLQMEIADNGRGLSEPLHPGFGLTGMRERAQKIGADLEIKNLPTGGVCVKLSLKHEPS